MGKTLYDIFEVPVTATAEAIEASNQRLRDELQGKADAGDQDARMRLVAVREAYQTLSEPSRRRMYDVSVSAREKTAATASELADELPDGFDERLQRRKSLVFKGTTVLVLVAVGIYSVTSYREAEAERLEKIRVVEARKQAIEMEKLAIERAKAEGDAAAQRQRELNLEMQKERQQEAAARTRAAMEQQALVRKLLDEDRSIREKENDRLRRSTDEQLKQQLESAERERKLNNEKAALRKLCEARYNRPDC